MKSNTSSYQTSEASRNYVQSRNDSNSFAGKAGSHDSSTELSGMPTFHRSNTMPISKPPSKTDSYPSKSSNLKHTETHDSGYGSSSSPYTPEMREESPRRRPKETKTKYQIVDPDSSDDDRTQVRRVDGDSDYRQRRCRSPQTMTHETRRGTSDRADRPTFDPPMRPRTTREAVSDHPKMYRSEAAKYDERLPPRESRPIGRHASAREAFYGESNDMKYHIGDRDRYEDLPSLFRTAR